MSMFLSLVSILFAGMFFVYLSVGEGRKARFFPGFIPASFFVGMGVITLQMFMYSVVGMEYSIKNLIVSPLIFLILLLARYLSAPQVPLTRTAADGRGLSVLDKMFLGIMAVQFFWIVFQVIPVPFYSHDAVANFVLKAEIFFTGRMVPAGFYMWPEQSVARPDYPPMLSFIMTWIYSFTGFDDRSVNLLMPVVYLMFLFLFYSQVRRFFSKHYAILAVFVIATIPQIADHSTIMCADLLLCAFISAGLGFAVIYASKRDRGCLFVSAMFMGMSVWLKNEALVFGAAYLAVLAMLFMDERSKVGSRARYDIVRAVLISGFLAGVWLIFRARNAAVNSDIDPSLISAERLMMNFKDIPVLLNLFQQEVFGPKKWNIFWVLFFASLVVARRKLWKGEIRYMTVFVLISFFGYFIGYMATTGHNLFFYVNTTISRFMIHFAGICTLLMAFLMYDTVGPLIEDRGQ